MLGGQSYSVSLDYNWPRLGLTSLRSISWARLGKIWLDFYV